MARTSFIISMLLCSAIASAKYCPPSWGYTLDEDTLDRVVNSSVTVTLPEIPPEIKVDVLAIFPGLLTDGGFIQPLISHGNWTYCGPSVGDPVYGEKWCAVAVNYIENNQRGGRGVIMEVGQQVILESQTPFAIHLLAPHCPSQTDEIEAVYNNNGNTTGYVKLIDGTIVSQLNTKGHPSKSYTLSMEWQGGFDAMMPGVTFSNLRLVYSRPVPEIPFKIQVKHAYTKNFNSLDGGTTWTADEIRFHPGMCTYSN